MIPGMVRAQRSRKTMSRRFTFSTLFVSIALCCGSLHAQVPDSGAGAPPGPGAADEGDVHSDSVLEPDLDAPAAPSTAGEADQGIGKIELQLASVREERANTTRLLPWLTVGVGAGAVLVAAATGAGYALSCEDSCDTPNWINAFVVAGATVATLGAIWVIHRDADIRELDSRRYHLEQELLRLRLSRPAHAAAFERGPLLLSLSLRL